MRLDEMSDLIRSERKNAGFTIQRLSELAGVDRTLLSRLENKRLSEIGYTKIERVLEVLGLQLVAQASTGLPTLRDLQRQAQEYRE